MLVERQVSKCKINHATLAGYKGSSGCHLQGGQVAGSHEVVQVQLVGDVGRLHRRQRRCLHHRVRVRLPDLQLCWPVLLSHGPTHLAHCQQQLICLRKRQRLSAFNIVSGCARSMNALDSVENHRRALSTAVPPVLFREDRQLHAGSFLTRKVLAASGCSSPSNSPSSSASPLRPSVPRLRFWSICCSSGLLPLAARPPYGSSCPCCCCRCCCCCLALAIALNSCHIQDI